MTETVVRVSTIEEWKAVLDVWFKQGHTWVSGDKDYHEEYFDSGVRRLRLTRDNNILKSSYTNKPFIKCADFMSQQKEEDNKMETYYVTQEQFYLIEKLKSDSLPFFNLVRSTTDEMKELAQEISDELDSKILRYIGGDKTIELLVKDPLYRLSRIDDDGDMVYMHFHHGTPSWTTINKNAFTAPLEEIKKWKTPAWNVEEAK